MSNDLIHIAQRIHQTPLLIHPAKLEVIVSILGARIGAGDFQLDLPEADMNRFVGTPAREQRPMGLSNAHKGVAIIPVEGTLVNRGAWLGSKSGMTSYEGLKAQLFDAAADPEIKSIMLDINSAGGEAGGAFDLANAIREVKSSKRVVALVNDMAASAAYAIASAANEIVVSPTSTTGSIGVVMTHLDRSAEMAAKGIKPTFIYAGAHKVDGNPYMPLPEGVRADLQASVDNYYEQFVNAVAAGRGMRFSADQARATEARMFIGAEAIKLGLADRIGSFETTLADLTAATSGRRQSIEQRGVISMSHTEGVPAADLAGNEVEAQEAQLDVVAEDAFIAGTEAERARIGAIIRSEHSKDRMDLAMSLALDTSLSFIEAEKVLASAPINQSIAARAAAAPEVGAEFTAEAPAKPKAASWDKALARVNARIG